MKSLYQLLAIGISAAIISACGPKENERHTEKPKATEPEVIEVKTPPPPKPPTDNRPIEERVIGTWNSIEIGDLDRQGIDSVHLEFTNDQTFISSAKSEAEEINRRGTYSFVDEELHILFKEQGATAPERAQITFEGPHLIMTDQTNGIRVTFARSEQ